eukprot:SAG31_NODE_15505_length_751_cov_1.417178_1_plen_86_part_10
MGSVRAQRRLRSVRAGLGGSVACCAVSFSSSQRRLLENDSVARSAAGDGRKPVALVVGVGPLSGIGGACAKKLADEGYHVVMMGRT